VVELRGEGEFDLRLERLDDRLRDRLEAVLEVERGERGLEQGRQHVSVLREARDLGVGWSLGLGQQALAEIELPRDDRTACPRDDVRANLRHPTLAEHREAVEERARDRQLEHRVSEELEAFVGGRAVGGPRRVREDRRRPLGRECRNQLPQAGRARCRAITGAT
jgi:hypothetical protein